MTDLKARSNGWRLAAIVFLSLSIAVSGVLSSAQTAAAASSANLWAVPVNSRIDDGNFQMLKLKFNLDTGNLIEKIRVTIDGTKVLEFKGDGTVLTADPAFVSVEGSIQFKTDGYYYMVSKLKGKFTIAIDKTKLTVGDHQALAEIIRIGGDTIADDAKFRLRAGESTPSDLIPAFFKAPNMVQPDKKYNAFVIEENEGTGKAKGHSVGVYLSDDDELDAGDTLVGEKQINKLKAGNWKIVIVKFELPSDADLGSSHLVVKVDADDEVAESNEDNNTDSDQMTVVQGKEKHNNHDDEEEEDD